MNRDPHVHQPIGQTLIAFDVDAVARKACSLLTQILIANVEKVARFIPGHGLAVAGKSVALTLELVDSAETAAPVATVSGSAQTGEAISLPNPSGLHARPAAVLAAEAKKFKSDIRLLSGTTEANAKSVVALMGLATKQGDVIHSITLEGDVDAVLAAQAERVAEWNKHLAA